MSSHAECLNRLDKLDSEIKSLETQASVQDKVAAFQIYDGSSKLREVYFGAFDKEFRKALIAKSRQRQQEWDRNFYSTLIADATNEHEALLLKGSPFPWVWPSLLGCITVGIGYSIWSLPGALAGTLIGFFLGLNYINTQRSGYAEAIRDAEQNIANLKAQHVEDKYADDSGEVFSAEEEESGSRDERGDQPIHWAARIGDVEEIMELVASGAKVDAVNECGSQPIHRAAENGNVDAIKALLAAGAKVDAVERRFINQRISFDSTEEVYADDHLFGGYLPIHLAATHGHADVLKVLIAAGSPVDIENSYGMQPIHLAAKNGSTDAIRVLLEAGAKAEAADKESGNQPLHLAALNGNEQAVRLLLKIGVKVDALNKFGAKAIDLASNNKHTAIIEILTQSPESIFRTRIRGIKATLDEVYPKSLDDWVQGFELDGNPEQELFVWECMALTYRTFTDGHTLSMEAKDEALQVTLQYSLGKTEEQMFEYERKILHKEDIQELMSCYRSSAETISRSIRDASGGNQIL